MVANILARVACAMVSKTIRLRGKSIYVVMGSTVYWKGEFVEALFDRVSDGRGLVFYVKAAPSGLTGDFTWAEEATRPRLFEFNHLEWDERMDAWVVREF